MFLTISSGDVTTLTGYIAGLLGDLLPVLLIFIGIAVAMAVFRGITRH